ncbi:MAG: accessory factor UbiK family protein [Telmatospirillum sp.]|nr:accessory factor UbiK family protein [Telmatospirillum sp.]
MQTDNRLFDDLARMAGGALNALTGMKTEVESLVRQQIEQLGANLRLVTREEFDAVQAMAAKARDEQESLALRVAALEDELRRLKGDDLSQPAMTSVEKDKNTGAEEQA